jgi:copper chaperone
MTTLSIPDMTCGHCRASVSEALLRVAGATAVEVDLTQRTARVEGPADSAEMIRALQAIGFPATLLAAS